MKPYCIEEAEDGRISMETDYGTIIQENGIWKFGSFSVDDLNLNFDEVPNFFWAPIIKEATEFLFSRAPSDDVVVNSINRKAA